MGIIQHNFVLWIIIIIIIIIILLNYINRSDCDILFTVVSVVLLK
jgi:Trk-type K+ transport system membrane component